MYVYTLSLHYSYHLVTQKRKGTLRMTNTQATASLFLLNLVGPVWQCELGPTSQFTL